MGCPHFITQMNRSMSSTPWPMGRRKVWSPLIRVFYSYLLFAVYGLYFILGKFFGVFENAVEFGTAYFIDPTGLFFVGRFLSVLVGVATIWLTYKIGQRFFSKRIALLASAVLGLSFTHVNLSHWILIEPTVAFMSALALYLILGFYEAPSLKSSEIDLRG